MKIGIQKLTLIDYPGKVAATLFFSGCNFCCPFCHNASLVINKDNPNGMDENEILSFLKKRSKLLEGVCISGGEPLMQKGIEDFIIKIKNLGLRIKIDTNGQFFEKLEYLIENKLIDYVAMDIKNSLQSYGKTIGIENFNTKQIEKSADFLINGTFSYEFRTTVVRELHKEDDFHLIGKRFIGAQKYFLQSFADSGDTLVKGLSAYSKEEMNHFKNILAMYVPTAALREI